MVLSNSRILKYIEKVCIYCDKRRSVQNIRESKEEESITYMTNESQRHPIQHRHEQIICNERILLLIKSENKYFINPECNKAVDKSKNI